MISFIGVLEHGVLKIAFDPWVFSSRFSYHGTQIYARNLLSEFSTIVPSQTTVRICLFSSEQHGNGFQKMAQLPGFEVVNAPLLRFDRLWRVAGLGPAAARARGAPGFLSTS